MADGDAISIFGSSHIWIDHNSLSNCADGLIDAIMGSTAITISNNYMTHHNEVSFIADSTALGLVYQNLLSLKCRFSGNGDEFAAELVSIVN